MNSDRVSTKYEEGEYAWRLSSGTLPDHGEDLSEVEYMGDMVRDTKGFGFVGSLEYPEYDYWERA